MSTIVQHISLNNVLGYTGPQRAGFAGILIGFVMCVVGCFPPYWKTGNISMESIITVNMLDIKAGLWLFCVKVIGTEEKCGSTSDFVDTVHEISSLLHIKDTSRQWLYITCGASVICIFLSLLCGLTACCRFCCCSGGKTICHGITAFVAGACGIAVVAVFSLKADEIYGLSVLDLDYGWAFFVFMAGSVILVISSFLLCCSSPRENAYQLMTTPSVPLVVAQTSTSTQMNAAPFPPAQGPIMCHEMETQPGNIEYGQGSSQFNKY